MDGIVFDLFHTLVDPEEFRPSNVWRLRTVAETIGGNGRDLVMFWKDTYRERTTTPVSGTDLVLRYAEERDIDLDEAQVSEISRAMGDYQDAAIARPRPDVVAVVAALARDFELAVLSNCYLEEVRAWPGSPLEDSITTAVFSYAIGARKPEPQAYVAATGRLGLSPAACAFVGNGGSNELAGARDAGFALVVHQNQFDAKNGLVTEEEQERRAAQADRQITDLAQLTALLD
jgi:putative hydrolase of the HAD superfamily